MKIILLSSGIYSIPAMQFLNGQNNLQAVASLGEENSYNAQIAYAAQQADLPYKRFIKSELLTTFKSWLSKEQPDMVLVFGCPYKIPGELLAIPKLGFFNVHFSLLSAYRGKDPVFWQLKNGETIGGITIHQMTKNFDDGPILVQQKVPIFPGENQGLYTGRLSMESVRLIAEGIYKLESEGDALKPQAEEKGSNITSFSINELKIDWQTQTAVEIENLVNASNPDYGGALTLLRGQLFRIFEVNPVELNAPSVFAPGTIVHSDTNYGIIVACKDLQFLRLNVIQSNEGIFSGFKLAGLGIAAGEQFESAGTLANTGLN